MKGEMKASESEARTEKGGVRVSHTNGQRMSVRGSQSILSGTEDQIKIKSFSKTLRKLTHIGN